MLKSLTVSLNIVYGSGRAMNAKLFAISLDPQTYNVCVCVWGGGVGVDATPEKVYSNCDKTIDCEELKRASGVFLLFLEDP